MTEELSKSKFYYTSIQYIDKDIVTRLQYFVITNAIEEIVMFGKGTIKN